MHALVTGATGFIGRHLVQALCRAEHHVRALVRDPRKVTALPAGIEVRSGDLAAPGSLEGLARDMDVVFHLAGATSGDWDWHRRATVEGTKRMLAAARAEGVRRFVHVSSLAVYDRSELPHDAAVREDCPVWQQLDVAGCYARGKIEAERLVRRELDEAETDWVIVRPGLVYGPGRIVFEHLGLRLGSSLFLPLGGASVRLPLVHVESLVDALMRLAVSAEAGHGTFTVVDDEQPSKSVYLQLLAHASGRRLRCVGVPAAPLLTASRLLARARTVRSLRRLPELPVEKVRARTFEHRYDCAALRRATNWQPKHDLRAGILASVRTPRARAPVTIRRAALIGAGRMAELHIKALRAIGIEVVGVLDRDADRANDLATRFELPVATASGDELYARAQPQSVHILTPPQHHAALALDAIRRGMHVFVEKPLAVAKEECLAMRTAAARHHVTVGINHSFVTDARVRRCREAIECAAIGELVHVDIAWAFDARRLRHALDGTDGDAWMTRLPGGPLEDLAPHPLSIALALANQALSVRNAHAFRSGRFEQGFDDELRLLLAGESVTAAVSLTLSAAPDDLTVAVYGTRATWRLDLQNLLLLRSSRGRGPRALARGMSVLSAGVGTLLQTARNAAALALGTADAPGDPRTLIRQHYAALASGAPLPVDLEQGRRVVEIVREIWPVELHVAQVEPPRVAVESA